MFLKRDPHLSDPEMEFRNGSRQVLRTEYRSPSPFLSWHSLPHLSEQITPMHCRYWNRGLRSYLRNETNYFAIEGRVWGVATKWRPYPRDQGKFIAIRDGTNLTAVFGSELETTPWQKRFEHAMSLPFYQAHPDQLERIEDNFEMLYRNLLGKEVR